MTEGNNKPDVTVNSEVSGEACPMPAQKKTPPSKPPGRGRFPQPTQSSLPTLKKPDLTTYRLRIQCQRVRSWGWLWWDGGGLAGELIRKRRCQIHREHLQKLGRSEDRPQTTKSAGLSAGRTSWVVSEPRLLWKALAMFCLLRNSWKCRHLFYRLHFTTLIGAQEAEPGLASTPYVAHLS